jgi:predicted MFS family arabinose efflux permease
MTAIAGFAPLIQFAFLATGSQLAFPFGIAVFITSLVVGRLGSRHRLRPSVIIGYAIAPAEFAAMIGNVIYPGAEWVLAGLIMAMAGVIVLSFLPNALKLSRIRHLAMLAKTSP